MQGEMDKYYFLPSFLPNFLCHITWVLTHFQSLPFGINIQKSFFFFFFLASCVFQVTNTTTTLTSWTAS